MHSFLLVFLVLGMLGVPGIAASLLAFPPAKARIVTRLAAAFGLGYAASSGCAFVLARVHALGLDAFIGLWLAVSAALWLLALRRASFREHARALASDVGNNRLPLLLGLLVVIGVVIVRVKYLHVLGAPRYVYYLDGVEIANRGEVPLSTLQYGQSWPPATDKVLLDVFTAVVVLLGHNPAIGPGALVVIAVLGAAIGLWATAVELGLRWTGALLPLLLLGNQAVLGTAMSADFTEYRAEDFGRAVAFCALALGIVAIREHGWDRAVIAGVVLAAAAASHLVPVVVVSLALCFVGVAELLCDHGMRERLTTLRQGAVLAAVSGVLASGISMVSGGDIGLQGARNPSGYAAIHTRFDPTFYLYAGKFLARDRHGSGHWYLSPRHVVHHLMAAAGLGWPAWAAGLLFAGSLLAAALLFLLAPPDLRITGVVGLGVTAGMIGIGLFFSYRYHIYIDAMFGVRRMADYGSFGLILSALGALECVLLFIAHHWRRLTMGIAATAVVLLAAWLLPSALPTQRLEHVSHERIHFVDWVRSQTPCNARFLANQRTEGVFTALTGRFSLMEGMGPFLRIEKLPYVVDLALDARHFFHSPRSNEAFLRQHKIAYVVVTRSMRLGSRGPIGRPNIRQLDAAPFLHRVLGLRYVYVYKVVGTQPVPTSPLLKGSYLHCMTAPVHF